MCGRYTLRTPTEELIEVFGLGPTIDFPLRYNIAPTQDVPVVIRDRDSQARELVPMHWGLVPFWAKDLSTSSRMINARAESVAEKPAFRQAFLKRRCLVPSDGYFEWQKVEKRKQPYYIHRPDDRLFAFAGLWEVWHGTEPPLLSYSIITVPSSGKTQFLHDRMPLILSERDYEEWLDPANQNAEALQRLLSPSGDPEMRVDPVNPRVNNVRFDDPDCISLHQRELFD